MTRRTYLGIIAEILSFCKRPQNKTRIMYHSNLSWKVLQNYLSLTESKGLLQIHYSPIKYATTQKGLMFVEKWGQLTGLLNSDIQRNLPNEVKS